MKVLQFAFGGEPDNFYLPHTYEPRCVVYPATHDNQTTIGWFAGLPERDREQVQRYLGKDGSDIAWDFIRLALASWRSGRAAAAGRDAARRRGADEYAWRGEGNGGWRFGAHQLHPGLAAGLAELTASYGRKLAPERPRGYDPFDYTAPETAHPLHDAGEP
jgi:4-alpha-glucanotransferase